jgi:hypothetical protein
MLSSRIGTVRLTLELARLLLHHPALKGRPPVFVGRDAEAVG